jgi:AhpD family alkylhydroperoxidase
MFRPAALLIAAMTCGAEAAQRGLNTDQTSCAAPTRAMRLAIDDCDDRVDHRLFGRPGQLRVIDGQDCLAARGGRGLFDCNLEADERQASSPAFLPLLTQEEAWQTLPTLEHGTKDRLPLWALATAKALPRTTAAVLELEYRHRAASPLDATLRAQIRLIAAHANRCGYTQAQSEADLRRGGSSDAEIKKLLKKEDSLPPVLRFARKLTLAAYTVTDAEVAELVKSLGEKQLVAVVQLLAFSNFQDRLVLALGIATGGLPRRLKQWSGQPGRPSRRKPPR